MRTKERSVPTPQARTLTLTRNYRREVKRCPYCFRRFVGIYCQVYCDLVCRNRAYYQRKQDREEAKIEQKMPAKYVRTKRTCC